jgi:parallel beta-helix repeat protein
MTLRNEGLKKRRNYHLGKIYLIHVFLGYIFINSALASNYYVSAQSGSDTNNGLTTSTPYKTLQRAASLTNPGDTVFVMDGTYSNSGTSPALTISRSGTASNWIVWIKYPGHEPLISFNWWHGIHIRASYIELNGFMVRGNNANVKLEDALNQPRSCNNPTGSYDAKFNGNGIYIDGRPPNVRQHHIAIRNCTVFDCGGGGIAVIQSDYITIENNQVFNNSWYSLFANSGISLYQMWNSDDSTGIKNIISGNICYGNRQFIPWPSYNCSFTDGNGIILDDFRNTQNNSNIGVYKGRTVVFNNIVFNNGGSGIHSYLSDHIDIMNNTAWLNSQTPEINGGEIFANSSGNVRIFNNILYALPNKRINSNWNNSAGIIHNYNLHHGGNSTAITGAQTVRADPKFTDAENGDFRLQSDSPAIDKGIASLSGAVAPGLDFTGNPRPMGSGYDIGAYEYSTTTGMSSIPFKTEISSPTLYPNPVRRDSPINIAALFEETVEIAVYNTCGSQSFASTYPGNSPIIFRAPNKPGIYLVNFKIDNEVRLKKLIVL